VAGENGFNIQVFGWLISRLQDVSLVELFKQFGVYLRKRRSADCSDIEIRSAANLWVDIFVISKWLLLLLFFIFQVNGFASFLMISYLLFFNLFSYFVYHAWGSDFGPPPPSIERDRRRLMNFLQAFFYSIVGFAYLYFIHFPCNYVWPTEANWLDAIYLSISNSFTLTYEGFQPKDRGGRGLLLLQVANVFVFLTILISNSVPNLTQSDRS
jgi:hypothetical protein